MNQRNQTKHFEDLVTRMRETMLKKGNDYAGKSDDVDRLSNFKQTAYINNVSPAKAAMILIGIKMTRLTSLLDSGLKPENESVQDTCLDLCNYTVLLDAIVNESKYL